MNIEQENEEKAIDNQRTWIARQLLSYGMFFRNYKLIRESTTNATARSSDLGRSINSRFDAQSS